MYKYKIACSKEHKNVLYLNDDVGVVDPIINFITHMGM